MFRQIQWFSALFFFLLVAQLAKANDFNTATVPVADYSSVALDQALPHALSQVLTQRSGNPLVTTTPQVQKELPHAKQWMQSYSYQTVGQDSIKPGVFVQVTFDSAAVTQLLKQAPQENLPEVSSSAVSSSNHSLKLVVLGIDNLNDYSAALSDLRVLPTVTQVIVSRVVDGELHLQIQMTGGIDKLKDALDSDSHWVSESETEPAVELGTDQDSTLHYRWMGNEE